MLKKYNLKTNQVTNLILTNTKKPENKIYIINTKLVYFDSNYFKQWLLFEIINIIY